ncbi:MAG: hypothetical protein R1F52_00090 [Candidatus Nitrosoabyssus spongiisocia]|nr:MAG: hypothetical protein R1F52_00090 [Nitrosopumilaceae archaeon AB1(1)]
MNSLRRQDAFPKIDETVEVGIGSLRLPPGVQPPWRKIKQFQIDDPTKQFVNKADKLLEITSSNIIPSKHPLDNKERTLASLSAENKKLQQENIELKKLLDSKARKN